MFFVDEGADFLDEDQSDSQSHQAQDEVYDYPEVFSQEEYYFFNHDIVFYCDGIR